MRLAKIMLVGAELPAPVMDLLLDGGSRITKIPTGKAAISYAQQEMFDAVIILSTGEEMDAAETIFNLCDINSAMQVILVSDRTSNAAAEIPKDSLERVLPNTKIMTVQELCNYLNCKKRRPRNAS